MLAAAGAPFHATPRGGTPNVAQMRDAVLTVISATGIEPWVLESIGAFTLAWAHEWPTGFGAAFGANAPDVGVWARSRTPDAGRYLKLRRIAIANLAGIL